MASELKQRNEDVAMLFMLDTFPWVPKPLVTKKALLNTDSESFVQISSELLVRLFYDKFKKLNLLHLFLGRFYYLVKLTPKMFLSSKFL